MSDAQASTSRGGVNRFFVAFAAVLVLIGIAAAVFGGWRLVDTAATSVWAQTSATVTAVETVRTSLEPGKAPKHEYRVTVEYVVDDQRLTITYRTQLQTVEPRIGSTTLVRYDPDDPADARRGSGAIDLVAGPIVGTLGLVFLVGGLVLFRRARRGPISLPVYRSARTINPDRHVGRTRK